jgi:hypothetical protein
VSAPPAPGGERSTVLGLRFGRAAGHLRAAAISVNEIGMIASVEAVAGDLNRWLSWPIAHAGME